MKKDYSNNSAQTRRQLLKALGTGALSVGMLNTQRESVVAEEAVTLPTRSPSEIHVLVKDPRTRRYGVASYSTSDILGAAGAASLAAGLGSKTSSLLPDRREVLTTACYAGLGMGMGGLLGQARGYAEVEHAKAKRAIVKPIAGAGEETKADNRERLRSRETRDVPSR